MTEEDIISKLRAIGILVILVVTVISVVTYVWLIPESSHKGGINPVPTSTTQKVDIVPTKDATSTSTPPTPTKAPQATPTKGAVQQPTQQPPQNYTGPCLSKSPYGFTTVLADSNLVSLYKQMNVCWVRLQVHEGDLQKSDGSYDFTNLDAIVDYLTGQGIHIDMPLECFDGPAGSGGGNCFGTPYVPTPDEMTKFATALATRYNGSNGHGRIEAYEILNEEPDQNSSYNLADYAALLKAGYTAIKAASPGVVVGMYGTYPSSLDRTTAVLDAIFQNGGGPYLDFLNFHYYNQGLDPMTDRGTTNPSFDHKWQYMRSVAANYGFNKPVWVTEIGWPTSPLPGRQASTPEQQAQYLQYVSLRAAASGGAVQRMFWYTLNMNVPNAIYPPAGPQPAFNTLIGVVKQYPFW